MDAGRPSRRLLQSSREKLMVVTWTRIIAVEVKRIVDPRAILEVVATGLGNASDTGGEGKRGEYDDSNFSGFCSWNGGAIHKEIGTRRDHFDENHKFSLGHVEVWGFGFVLSVCLFVVLLS